MKLKLRRSQQAGMTGTVKFSLNAIVELDEEETAALNKYKFGKTIVYETPKGAAANDLLRSTGSLRGVTAALAAKATNQSFSVNSLVKGTEITCKDISEMITVEEQLLEGCQALARILFACRHFEGEEIIDIEPFAPET